MPRVTAGHEIERSQEIGTVGHKSTRATETVYRHVIVPAIRGGATAMDSVFEDEEDE
jgi:hypothetical protein